MRLDVQLNLYPVRARGGQKGGRIPLLDHHLLHVDAELQVQRSDLDWGTAGAKL